MFAALVCMGQGLFAADASVAATPASWYEEGDADASQAACCASQTPDPRAVFGEDERALEESKKKKIKAVYDGLAGYLWKGKKKWETFVDRTSLWSDAQRLFVIEALLYRFDETRDKPFTRNGRKFGNIDIGNQLFTYYTTRFQGCDSYAPQKMICDLVYRLAKLPVEQMIEKDERSVILTYIARQMSDVFGHEYMRGAYMQRKYHEYYHKKYTEYYRERAKEMDPTGQTMDDGIFIRSLTQTPEELVETLEVADEPATEGRSAAGAGAGAGAGSGSGGGGGSGSRTPRGVCSPTRRRRGVRSRRGSRRRTMTVSGGSPKRGRVAASPDGDGPEREPKRKRRRRFERAGRDPEASV